MMQEFGSINLNAFSTDPQGELPIDTPTFSQTSYGIKARVPLVHCGNASNKAIAILSCKVENDYVGLLLVRSEQPDAAEQYEVTSIQRLVDDRFSEFRCIRTNQQGNRASSSSLLSGSLTNEVYVEWKDIYISSQRPTKDFLQPLSELCTPILPGLVIRKLRTYGFSIEEMPSASRTAIKAVHYLPTSGAPWDFHVPEYTTILTFTHSSVYPGTGRPETIHICLNSLIDEQMFKVGVVFNEPLPRNVPQILSSGLSWSGYVKDWLDGYWEWQDSSGERKVRIACMHVELPWDGFWGDYWIALDIDLFGSVYESLYSTLPSISSTRAPGPLKVLHYTPGHDSVEATMKEIDEFTGEEILESDVDDSDVSDSDVDDSYVDDSDVD
jgi:hypothetical protein